MAKELAKWEGGDLSLEGWVSMTGNFSFAVGYSEIFWPEFVEFEDYILRKGFSESSLRGFENQENITKAGVECVMNHLHIGDIQHPHCEDLSKDKIIFLGNILKEIYTVKLAWQFPDKPCVVEFYHPEDEEDLIGYQLYFWQKKHENSGD
ncbi:MAG: hypothetical protein KJ017_04715 [Alphaproteobacteria bacterium]|nr:hypothetical protein [Alphaproteobacteria bacterium]